MPLRSSQATEHLVSDQFARSHGLCSVSPFWSDVALCVPFDEFLLGSCHSSDNVSFGGTAVWSHAADVSTPANSSGRRHSADSLDRVTPQHLRTYQPAARRAD